MLLSVSSPVNAGVEYADTKQQLADKSPSQVQYTFTQYLLLAPWARFIRRPCLYRTLGGRQTKPYHNTGPAHTLVAVLR